MKQQKRTIQAALTITLTLLMLVACDKDIPTPPDRTNPFDPENDSTGGDPYNLQAVIANGGITLTWNLIVDPIPDGYNLYRKIDTEDYILYQTFEQVNTYIDQSIQNGHRYSYFVVAWHGENEMDYSNVVSVDINTTPVLSIDGDGSGLTETREISLSLLAFGAEQMRIGNGMNPGSAGWEPYQTQKQWTLQTGEGMKRVTAQFLYPGNDTSGVVTDSIQPAPLNASIVIAEGGDYTPTRSVSLQFSATGAVEMQIGNSDPPQGSEWIPYTASFADWTLTSGSETKTVYVRFRNDFLNEETVFDSINPATLVPTMQILPADSQYINHRSIRLVTAESQATHVLFANDEDSSGHDWTPHADTLNWNLSTGDGTKRVYTWFRNDFYTDGPATDSINVDTQAEIDTFYWQTSSGSDTVQIGDEITFFLQTFPDSFGPEINGSATAVVAGWNPVVLSGESNGSYLVTMELTNAFQVVENASVLAHFTDRVGNTVESEAANSLTVYDLPFEPGEVRTFYMGEADVPISMVFIPPGSFMMGAVDGDEDAESDELPRHPVEISEGFWIAKYETTQEQWEAITGENPSQNIGDLLPVENVSWYDVTETFIPILNYNEANNIWRLPTEAEWEYSARSGIDELRFWWGDDTDYDSLTVYAWFEDNSDYITRIVGSKAPNPIGLYDVIGNVDEWCSDWYSPDFYSNSQSIDPENATPTSSKVHRGASVVDWSENCRLSARDSYGIDNRSLNLGFRLVRELDEGGY